MLLVLCAGVSTGFLKVGVAGLRCHGVAALLHGVVVAVIFHCYDSNITVTSMCTRIGWGLLVVGFRAV